jgi:formylglycine-generating enzyme required for sulfatase activity
MVAIPGGEFTMGSDAHHAMANERPPHRVRVEGFLLDAAPVTNAQFSKFVAATRYVTTAEKKPDWNELSRQLPPGTPKPPDSQLVPGSLVYTPPGRPVPLDDLSRWWTWTPGASWRHPEGPQSSIEKRGEHPVVQVSWDDAVAYCAWAGKRLPTEAEWERAARGGLEGKRFPWGDEFKPGSKFVSNTYTGRFPVQDTAEDGWAGTSPVKTYPPNGYGLFDMGGNVWNWTSDWYRVDYFAAFAQSGKVAVDPKGPERSYDPAEPNTPKRVTKGGSFLCSSSYCESFRPSARRGTSPDTGSGHVGFRCAMPSIQASLAGGGR